MNGYFIIKGRPLVNEIISNCTLCRRYRGRTNSQMMADLPNERVRSSAPFDDVGMDVFGPFFVHDGISTRRNKAKKKMNGLLITCLSSRVIHVEPLVGLDTVSFINAMRRFTAIRGPCRSIVSDQGTNFVGALSSLIDFQQVQDDASFSVCTWKKNPPGASHFGGIYERKIGSVRRILEGFLTKKSSHNLSRDEMCTLLQEACSIVNATPLYGVSDDPNVPFPLTPSMILTLKSDTPSPNNDITADDIGSYGRKRWRKVQQIANDFWKDWHSFYLSDLQDRKKWKFPRASFSEGDVVLIKSKTAARNQWNMGLVEETFKGSDGLIRKVLLRVCPQKGRERSVVKAIHDLVYLCGRSEGIAERECAVPK